MAGSLASGTLGRNSPCSCGSGKRYKDCHGAIGASLSASVGPTDRVARRASQYRAPDAEWGHLSDEQRDALGVTMEAALAHQTAGRQDEAARLYREALKTAPKTHDALHMLGVIEWSLGDLDRGEALILEAMTLRPAYQSIQSNLQMLRAARLARSGAIEDELAELALPILNDLMLKPLRPGRGWRPATSAADVIHLIGRFGGADDDGSTLRALAQALSSRTLRIWSPYRGSAFVPSVPGCTAIDPRSGRYPSGGTHVFVGVNYELGDWIERSDADQIIVLCGRGRPSVYLTQLRAIAMDGARRIELAFASRSRAERFGSGHVILPVPTCELSKPVAARSTNVPIVDSGRSERPWSVGIVGQVSDRVDPPVDADFIAEIAHSAGALVMHDPGPYRFELGASRSVRFLERTPDGPDAFLSEIDCLFCRRQPWWDEDDGRGILAAMARGLPVICPRSSIHSDFIEDRASGLLYRDDDEALALVMELRRASGLAADLGAAARAKAAELLDPIASANSLRPLFPEPTRLAAVSR
jgi:glycosyltransferase involved in cell wall biosynthesis